MTKYRFIRTGHEPTSQVDNEAVITSCFEYCKPDVRTRLEWFFAMEQEAVEFEFRWPKLHTVRIERIQ